jgi:hypothetical protein
MFDPSLSFFLSSQLTGIYPYQLLSYILATATDFSQDVIEDRA